jgi:hypothetical protein
MQPPAPPDREQRAAGARKVVAMVKRTRIEKPKPRVRRQPEARMPLDPRDPDVVRVKRGWVWRYADRRWAE